MLIAGAFVIAGFILIGLALNDMGGPAFLAIGFTLTGHGYGNVAPCISAIVYRLFGPTNYALNYSLVIFNGLVASFGSTLAGILRDLTGSYSAMVVSAIVLAIASLVLALLIRGPERTA